MEDMTREGSENDVKKRNNSQSHHNNTHKIHILNEKMDHNLLSLGSNSP